MQQTVYTTDQMFRLLKDVHVPDKLAETLAAIGQAESGGHLRAWNQSDPCGGSAGLWQVNGVHPFSLHWLRRNAHYDAYAAFWVARKGGGLRAWSTYRSGAYRRFLAHHRHTHVAHRTHAAVRHSHHHAHKAWMHHAPANDPLVIFAQQLFIAASLFAVWMMAVPFRTRRPYRNAAIA
jgi:hypothetical protein